VNGADPDGKSDTKFNYGGKKYSPNGVGDEDRNKGWPHWDGPGGKYWVGNDGVARDPNGCKTKIKNNNILNKIRQGVADWPERSGGKPVLPPQPNRFVPNDPPLAYDPVNAFPVAIAIGGAVGVAAGASLGTSEGVGGLSAWLWRLLYGTGAVTGAGRLATGH
jgi:hypothetical protein